jgi:hypothetical protein
MTPLSTHAQRARGPPFKDLALVTIIEQSGAIDPDHFIDVFIKDKEFHRRLIAPPLWASVASDDDHFYDMDDYVLRSMCRESACEALHIAGAIPFHWLKRLRRSLLRAEVVNLNDLLDDAGAAHIDFEASNLTRLRDRSSLFIECYDAYMRHDDKANRVYKGSEFYHAEYIRVLTGKLLHNLPAVPLVSEATHRAHLDSLIEVYRRGYEHVAKRFKVTKAAHISRLSQAQEETDRYYSQKRILT